MARKTKATFSTPAVLEEISFYPEGKLLLESIAEDTEVKTTGQESGGFYDSTLEDSTFNHDWK